MVIKNNEDEFISGTRVNMHNSGNIDDEDQHMGSGRFSL